MEIAADKTRLPFHTVEQKPYNTLEFNMLLVIRNKQELLGGLRPITPCSDQPTNIELHTLIGISRPYHSSTSPSHFNTHTSTSTETSLGNL